MTVKRYVTSDRTFALEDPYGYLVRRYDYEKLEAALAESKVEVERLEVVIAAADKMREGIREASIKREPGLYECVMRYDALRATLDGATT